MQEIEKLKQLSTRNDKQIIKKPDSLQYVKRARPYTGRLDASFKVNVPKYVPGGYIGAKFDRTEKKSEALDFYSSMQQRQKDPFSIDGSAIVPQVQTQTRRTRPTTAKLGAQKRTGQLDNGVISRGRLQSASKN